MSKFLTSKYQSLAQWHQWMVRIGSSLHGLSDSLPLALKWSLVIAAFVSLVMGALGSYLISKQEESFREQSNMLGQVLADQLASSASEPLLADDTLTLDMLVSQQKKHQMISGMQIYTRKGRLKASAGNAVKAKIM
ncbi:MAG: hypothetical protein OEZ23_00285, partial [Gammaproteobacteria bacterium]|nr:hypothetical protein [Gammaproteobacteria bacterium]